MTKYLSVWLIGAVLVTSSLSLWAQTVDKPARVISSIVKKAAIVEAVNPETREIKIIDAQGNRFSVVADELVRNFAQIEPRDRIVLEYLESVAVVVIPAGAEEPLFDEITALTVAPEGDRPGVTGVSTEVVTATVQTINLADRLVTLKSQSGEVRNVKVSDDARLDLVEVGDQVRFRITTAIALSVVKPGDGD
jgi:hypothetical protein